MSIRFNFKGCLYHYNTMPLVHLLLFTPLFSLSFALSLEVINDINKIIAQVDINWFGVSQIVSKILPLPENYKTTIYKYIDGLILLIKNLSQKTHPFSSFSLNLTLKKFIGYIKK